MDDNKISRVDQKVVDEILEVMTNHFGEMTVTKGKSHDFLGITFKLHDNKVKIGMKEQSNEAIDMFMDDVNQSMSNPASTNLFHSRELSSKNWTRGEEQTFTV